MCVSCFFTSFALMIRKQKNNKDMQKYIQPTVFSIQMESKNRMLNNSVNEFQRQNRTVIGGDDDPGNGSREMRNSTWE